MHEEGTAIAKEALKLLCQFSNSYLCEVAFSALATIKNKNRSCFKNVDMCMRMTLNNVEPRFNKLVKKMQEQQSH